MTTENVDCEHRCRNTCAMLNKILLDERNVLESCSTMVNDCSDPMMLRFAEDLLKTHSSLRRQIEEKLTEIGVKAGVLDDIIEGLENQ